MDQNRKKIALIVLLLLMVWVWWPKTKANRPRVKSSLPLISFARESPAVLQRKALQKQRSEFAGWGRNPFSWSKSASPDMGLNLSGIIWDEQSPRAIIDGNIVGIGDDVSGKIIKQITTDSVTLTDGTSELELRVGE